MARPARAGRRARADRGVLELPLIVNPKTVDPTDPSSTPVIQMESAMGAAIEVFEGSTVIEVDRSRFLPVKATSDLLLLRSDVYELADDFTLSAQVEAPLIDLDGAHYKLVGDFDARFARECHRCAGDWARGAWRLVVRSGRRGRGRRGPGGRGCAVEGPGRVHVGPAGIVAGF
ncbi:UTP--glucose-1-phosphate uridylyltransferase [Oerskovia sp. M15]